MFEVVALTGLFETRDLAVRAGEKLREILGQRGLVRVLFPGTLGLVVEVSVLPTKKGTFGVAVGGAILGLVGLVGMRAIGAGWASALLALGWGLLTGAMLTWWLAGSTQRARILRGLDSKHCYELLAGTPRAVVVVVAAAPREHAVRVAIEAGEGECFSGLNPWLAIATRAPLRTPEPMPASPVAGERGARAVAP